MKNTHQNHADSPASAQTAAKVVALLGLTEREAQAILSLPQFTAEQVDEAVRVNIHSLGAAFSESTVAAIVADKKLDVPVSSSALETDALHVRTLANASDKLQLVDGRIHAAARVEAGALAKIESTLVPQLRARAAVDNTIRTTFSALFAYHHAKNPGPHAKHPTPPVVNVPAQVGT